MDKYILCLANSYKHGGRCIAGIEVELNNGTLDIKRGTYGLPIWIRPVSHTITGEIPMAQARGIQVLSVIKVCDAEYAGNGAHSENWYYSRIENIQKINPSDQFLKQYIDSWHTNIFGNRGKALTPDAFRGGDYSLMLIRTERSEVYFEEQYKKQRIKFRFGGNLYDLPITDPEFIEKLRESNSLFKTYDVLYIVVSLGVEHEGWHSKLAATLIIPSTSGIIEKIQLQPNIVSSPLKPTAQFESSSSHTSLLSSTTQYVSTNEMTAKQLVIKQNAVIEFHDFDSQDGKHHSFFVCGNITGYVSPNAKKAIESGCTIDNLKYAEVSKDGEAPVPCLMVVGNEHVTNITSFKKNYSREVKNIQTPACAQRPTHTLKQTTSKLSNTSSGGCYIATAIYGSYNCPEVWTLRRFRDNFLFKYFVGRLFIKVYYIISPTLVKLFGHKVWFHNLVRPILDSFVFYLKDRGFNSTPYED
ncbi:MAG: hypothetical protein K2H97_10655 [Prevotella sp.]|nr:hypothetical protein [Prevotella sp.]